MVMQMQQQMFFESLKTLKKEMDCPFCNKGFLKQVTRKNYYHGKKSNCRKTLWKKCDKCNYNVFLREVEKERQRYNPRMIRRENHKGENKDVK